MFVIDPGSRKIRVYCDEKFDVHELKAGEKPPEGKAVFVCRPMDLDRTFQVPIGQHEKGEGSRRWRDFMVEMARDHVTDWEGVVDTTGKAVKFDSGYLVDGTLHPDFAGAIVFWLMGRLRDLRKGQTKKARAARSHKKKQSSGRRGRGLRIAGRAASSEKKPG